METIDKMTLLPDDGTHNAGPPVSATDTMDNNATALYAQNAATSPLLRLPGEIRNRIYEYALAADNNNKIHAKPFGFNGKNVRMHIYLPENEYIDFNQLKFVCRQLYKETAGTEAKFNTVYLSARRPAEMFVHFIATCSTKRAAWFRSVILTETNTKKMWPPIPESRSVLKELAKYCRLNPSSKVKYVLLSFSSGRCPFEFYMIGSWISMAIRHKKVPFYNNAPSPDVAAVQDMAGSWADAAFVGELNIPNLRFCPFGRIDFEKFEGKWKFNQFWFQYKEEWTKHGI